MSIMERWDERSGMRLQLDMPRTGELDSQLLEAVPALEHEDMRRINAQDMAGSYAVYSAYDTGPEAPILAGAVRQISRDYVPTDFDDKNICVSELATLWVRPEYRRHGVARSLVRFAAQTMDLVGIIPVAICNDHGRDIFIKAGFEEIGNLPSTDDNKMRSVQVYRPRFEWHLYEKWNNGLNKELKEKLKESLPRFADLQP
jgi:GNAT superfamily N-acetyltransferase